MSVEFEIWEVFPASPETVYGTWLDSEGHAAMTGSPAIASREVGGEFRAWDGYITGKNLALTPGKLIRQAWPWWLPWTVSGWLTTPPYSSSIIASRTPPTTPSRTWRPSSTRLQHLERK